jgi:uncharacterized protein (TIGR03000 family)
LTRTTAANTIIIARRSFVLASPSRTFFHRIAMKTSLRIALSLVLLAAFATWSAAQEKIESKITILVPHVDLFKETIVKVNGKQIDGEGGTRLYKTAIEKGKVAKLSIEVLIEPNNYTKITRVKEITIKGGENDNVKLTFMQDQAFDELTKADEITVRYVPTPDDIVDQMSKLAKITKNDVVYDLGCGNAIMLIRPIQKFGAKKGVGIEYDPEIMKLAVENVKKAKLEDKIELREGDMLKLKPKDLEDATVVLLYIGDDLGKRVSPVLKNSLKPGSRIVSHRFLLGDWTPEKTVMVKGTDGDEYTLHLWIVPAPKIEKSKAK